jgi:osmotically inducible lipoprotein OsmB
MKKTIVLLIVGVFFLGACSGMSTTEQRTLSGGAIGAAGGAAIGAIAGSAATGAAIGGPAGLLGGYLYDRYEKSKGNP